MKTGVIISSVGAAMLVTALAAGGTVIAKKANTAKTNWQADMRAQGINVEMADTLRWQLWPFGLKGGALSLETIQGEKLLGSPDVFLGFDPSDLFSKQVGTLHLQDAVFFYQRDSNGRSNWDRFFKNPSDSSLGGLILENATLEIQATDAAPAFSVSIPQLQWKGSGDTLQADFLLSSVDESQNNLLIEGSLHTHVLPKADGAWQLSASTLETTISSTRLPGILIFKSSGDILLQSYAMHSDNLKIQGIFKTPGQTQNMATDIQGTARLDWATGLLQLSTLSIKTGEQEWQLQGDMVASPASKTLHASKLAITRKSGKLTQRLEMNGISLSAKPDAGQQLINFTGTIGEGRVDIPIRSKLSADSAAFSATLNAQNVDLKSLRSWMNDAEARGTLTFAATAETQGHSLEELQEKVAGQLSLTLSDAQLGNISVMSDLRERLQGYATLLPTLAENTTPEKGTAIRTLELKSRLKDGIITTEKLHADIGTARLNASGSYDSRRGLMDYSGKLTLDSSLFVAQKNLDLPIVCQGNLHEEQVDFIGGLETDCKVDEKAKQDLLARALINRFRH